MKSTSTSRPAVSVMHWFFARLAGMFSLPTAEAKPRLLIPAQTISPHRECRCGYSAN